MEILNATEACFVVDDDLLDFSLETEDEENSKTIFKGASAASSSSSSSCLTAAAAAAAVVVGRETRSGSYPVFVEEELEWLSNKEAFPSVETCFGILSDNPELMSSNRSAVSMLDNSSSNCNGVASAVASFCCGLKLFGSVPVRPRSKRQRRKRMASFGELRNHQQVWWLNLVNIENKQESSVLSSPISTTTCGDGGGGGGARMGRRCLHCRAERTPQWRAGPMGPKTLCNACGVRYKSGRLLPEYRPANSPTFSGALHSNSHRKVVEMRRQKQLARSGGNNGRWNHG